MTEQDQQGKNLPAVPDKIIVAPIANDASLLAEAGFTDRLPVAMRDLNYVLGRTDLGARFANEPTVLSYTLETSTDTPTLARDVKYESGPKISLHVFPQEAVFSPDFKTHSARAVLEITNGIITSAFLTDLQDFVRETFPGKKATLHLTYNERVAEENQKKKRKRKKKETEPVYTTKKLDLDLHSLTEKDVNELPRYRGGADKKPYTITIEGMNGDSLFLVTGLDIIWKYKGEDVSELDATPGIKFAKQKRTFNLYQLTYDSNIFGGSGADIEKLLERFRQLAVKNPYLHMYLPQEEKLKKEGLI